MQVFGPSHAQCRECRLLSSLDFLSSIGHHLAHRPSDVRARCGLLFLIGHAGDVQLGVRHLVGDRLVGKGCAQQLQRPVVGGVLRVPVRGLTYSTTDEDDS